MSEESPHLSQTIPSALSPAVFFDRDGTLMEEVHYCADPALVRLFPGTSEALQRLRASGFLNVIITNQSGIGRGIITPEAYRAVHAELICQLEGPTPEAGLAAKRPPLIAATYFCADAPPTASTRRKPETGMVMEAAQALPIELQNSWFIGDKAADIECGRRAGMRTILVQTGYGSKETEVTPDFVAKDVVAAVEIILQNKDAKP